MARLGFDGLPPFAWPGGAIAGTLVLEVEAPTRARDLTLRLDGRERSQITVQAGKSSERLVQEAVFLAQEVVVHQTLAFVDPEHIAPGTYRVPFQFALPPGAPPSIRSAPSVGGSGWGVPRSDGLVVEYVLEARLVVPLWTDLVAQAVVPVFAPRRILGLIPPLESPNLPDRVHVVVDGSGGAPVVPGEPVRLGYRIENPGGKALRHVRFTLTRVIEHVARGARAVVRRPAYVAEQPLGGRAPEFAGTLEIVVPNTEDATGPWQGTLFAAGWTASITVDVQLGFDVSVSAPLVPA